MRHNFLITPCVAQWLERSAVLLKNKAKDALYDLMY